MRRLLTLIFPILLSACNSDRSTPKTDDGDPNDPGQGTVVVTSELKNGEDGWIAGFSDYATNNVDIFDLVSGIQSVPGKDNTKGFLVGGMNRSDDLFMYLKRRVTGLEADTRYNVAVDVKFWSDAGTGCGGIGGSPGESVFVKIGATEIEPKQANYYMNIDVGHQSESGVNAKVVGDVAVQGVDCLGGTFASKQLSLTSEMNFELISTSEGAIWVFVASDSGFEGRTHLYYETIKVTLTKA